MWERVCNRYVKRVLIHCHGNVFIVITQNKSQFVIITVTHSPSLRGTNSDSCLFHGTLTLNTNPTCKLLELGFVFRVRDPMSMFGFRAGYPLLTLSFDNSEQQYILGKLPPQQNFLAAEFPVTDDDASATNLNSSHVMTTKRNSFRVTTANPFPRLIIRQLIGW